MSGSREIQKNNQETRVRRTNPNAHLRDSDGYDWARAKGFSESKIHHMKYDEHNARLFARAKPQANQGLVPELGTPKVNP